MSDGRLVKVEFDHQASVDELLKGLDSRVESEGILSVLDDILALEKKARLDSDAISTGRLLEAMVDLLAKNCQWERLRKHLEMMSKKRSQLKQIYVEVERARLTDRLAKIKEANGDTESAASLLQDLQVETFGSMEKEEKVQFLLEQMRLSLARKDYIRTQISSKKISPKFFQEADHDDLKLKYYQLMIELDSHDALYLNISKHYWEIYSTNELLKLFTTKTLVRWDEFQARFEAHLRSDTDVFSSEKYPEVAVKRWQDTHSRVIEHNIRVIAAYYTKIRLSRMADLLNLSADETEKCLSELVVNKTVYARIDRLQGVVHFSETKALTDVLNEWSYNTNSLMSLINHTTHLINKERMIHGM